MTMSYKVIDNFLDEEYFDSLVTLITTEGSKEQGFMPWFFQPNITFPKNDKNWKSRKESENNSFYMNHTLAWLIPFVYHFGVPLYFHTAKLLFSFI